ASGDEEKASAALIVMTIVIVPRILDLAVGAARLTPSRYGTPNTRRCTAKAVAERLVELLQPDIPDGHLGDLLDFNPDFAALIVRRFRVVVDHHGHELSVDDVDERAAARDDDVLVPVIRPDRGA